MRNDDYSHNRRQTEYNQVYLNCWGAKEENNFLNYTNDHKSILEPSAILTQIGYLRYEGRPFVNDELIFAMNSPVLL